ncbi:NAD-dependent dihydropyrimidine dehydrogenase PreA subunit [Parabacteroides sp. PFB2-10]|uniref:ATP-binding protein n=1 Tax=Parabacteroides sp. PFB2-10 TaxID=1742405 RepID=UPI00247530FA|nr:4Fe-4S binding protein [Parabacteroides sp. PFB2-10]MDH6312031.1 NAD-dependent dihydropyrimidine dehydrogenase PreA subunit [Parabacteroides sp. PFB2-10]
MKRTIIKIDEEKCNGCGLCVKGCHEGALQLINGKAVLVSDMYCDGLGACMGDCPVDAITLIEREAEPYNGEAVKERMAPKEPLACGCPGSMAQEIKRPVITGMASTHAGMVSSASELRQFPIQLHLCNPAAGFFRNAHLLLAADCTAFASGDFHSRFLKNRMLTIACPKLDSNPQSYIDKLTALIDEARIETLTVLVMEVPCCQGLVKIAQMAREQAHTNIPIKVIVLSIQGAVKSEEWI